MTFKNLILSTALVCGTAGLSGPAYAGTDVYIGEITAVGFNFCPRGYAEANGALVAISSNTSLFSLLGTMYGGDGRSTFGLPDLQGRVPMGSGSGLGLTPHTQGAKGGQERVTLLQSQMPTHTHRAGLRTKNTTADQTDPTGHVFADTASNIYTAGPANGNFMAESTIQINNAGGSQPFTIVQPYQALKYCIATEGIYPPRN